MTSPVSNSEIPDAEYSTSAALAAPGGEAKLLSPRKLLMQILGFALGVALLAWCVRTAIKGGGDHGEGWEKIRHANPWLVAGLIGCTLASLAVNGAIFWLVIRPVRALKLRDMLMLNLVTAVLNYAPLRAGLIARVAYNLRVDRLSLLVIGGWFAAIGYTLALVLGALVLATIIRPNFDGLWLALAGGQIVIGGLLTSSVMGLSFVQKMGKGMDRMLRQRSALWGAIALRAIDVGAFAGRMACAVAILELPLSLSDTLLLAIAAIAVSLNPLGRVGYREMGVAFFAAYLGMSGSEFEAQRNQLALVESAGEAIAAIPLGLVALIWYRRRWLNAREN